MKTNQEEDKDACYLAKVEGIFELMVQNKIETFEDGSIKITRKSLAIAQEEGRLQSEVNRLKSQMKST